MNRFEILAATAALLASTVFAGPAAASTFNMPGFTPTTVGLSLLPDAPQIGPGSTLRLDLVAYGLGDHAAPSIGAFDVDIGFDPAVFSFAGAGYGGALGDTGLGEAYAETTPGPSSVKLSAYSLLEANAATCAACLPPYLEELQSGSAVLASLFFTGQDLGSGSFEVNVNALGDALGDSVVPILTAGPVVQVAPVPVPAAAWLFGSALAGIAAGVRRRRAG